MTDTLPSTAILEAALAAAARGWPVFPLAAGGKQPLTKHGFKDATLDATQVRAWWARWPDANYGIATGSASQLFVVDGDAPGALERVLGAERAAFVVDTPHDGRHAYFAWEEGLGNTQSKLGAQVDTRGEGGYVVGPGSVLLPGQHGDCKRGEQCPGGAYRATAIQAPGAMGPQLSAAVAALVRPAVRERVAVDWAELGRLVGTEAAQRYASTAIGGVLEEIAALPVGQRNAVGFARACRLLELANLGGYDPAVIAQAWAAVADRIGLPAWESSAIWESARRRVGDRPAELPADALHGSLLAVPADFQAAAQGAAPDGLQAVPSQVVDPRELAILQRVAALEIDREARRRLDARPARDWSTAMLSWEGVRRIRPLETLVDGWLYLNTTARFSGPSGHYKSYVTIELALCIATGRPWHGRKVQRRRVAYVLGEGAPGLASRIAAWMHQHDVSDEELEGWLYVLPDPVQVTGHEWASWVGHAANERFGAIIFDTQARMSVGLDENSATDMGLFVEGLEQLRAATQACVAVVHHFGKSGEVRGSTAVWGAMTTEISVRRRGSTVTVSCPKQKDAEEPDDLTLTWQAVDGFQDAQGRGNGVLVGAGDAGTLEAGGVRLLMAEGVAPRDVGAQRDRLLVQVLRRAFADGPGGTEAAIKAAYAEAYQQTTGEKLSHRRWPEIWGRMVKRGRIGRVGAAQRFKFVELEDADDLDANPAFKAEHDYVYLPG